MPISPQITIVPEDITFKSFDISAVSYTSTTATYTATGHTFSAGNIVMITGLAPDGYNGTYTITSVATNTFTVANTTNLALTDQSGNAYWADATEYEYEGGQTVAYVPNDDDVDAIVDDNATVAAAYAEAVQAQADAAAAQASASTAYDTAVAANTAASTAQTTANGKNKVTYSTASPGSTANTLGDIWFQYGTASPNVGRIIAQYMGNGGTSWTQTTVSGLVVANIDAGSITTGTLSVALGITGTSGNFSVNAVTGALVASSATITGAVNALSGYFGSSTDGYSINSTGLVGVGNGVIVGGRIQTSSGNEAVILNGSANAIQFKAAGSVVANMLPLISAGSAYGLLMHYGATPDSSGGTKPQMFIGSANISMSVARSGGGTNLIALNSSGASISDNLSVDNALTLGTATSSSTSQTAGVYLSLTGPVIARRDNQIPFFAHKFNATGTTEMMRLIYNGSDAGGITTTSGGVPAFRNASDYRLKQNIQSFDSAASLIKQINLRSFEFIKDPEEPQVGFIAHELAEVFPELVMGEKDAIDDEGNPVYQSILATNLIPYLTGALKEAILRIEKLEGK
jgi:hypothetical protein